MDGWKCVECSARNPETLEICAKCGAHRVEAKGAVKSSTGSSLSRGQIVAERYRVEELIGRGGMGIIYLVYDNVLKERLALKTLLPQFARDKSIVERFHNEARIARQLSHPNIVRVHDIGMEGDIMYLSMEFVRGQSLRNLMDETVLRNQAFQTVAVLRIMEQLCSALEYAHAHTVHRDIKPENVMVIEDGTVKLMDFGISKLVAKTRLTMTSMVMGTPQYMSPEQLRDSGKVDARADIYSLGVVLYEVLTGNLPVGVSKPASQARPDIPEALDVIIATCLNSDPDGRYQNAGDLRESLATVRRGMEGGKTIPPVPVRGAGKALRAIAGVLLSLVILAGAGFAALALLPRGDAVPSATESGAAPPSGTTEPLSSEALLAELREAAETAAQGDDEKAMVLQAADILQQTADPSRQTTAVTQCYLAILQWPTDGSLAFTSPAEVTLEDGSIHWVDGFFVDRGRVTVEQYAEFAQMNDWDPPSAGAPSGAILVGVPFHSALAFAVYNQKSVPDKAQWRAMALAAAQGQTKLTDLDDTLWEWTCSIRELPADETPGFGDEMIACGYGPMVSGGASTVKMAYLAYGLSDINTAIRLIKPVPSGMDAVRRALGR